MNIETVPENSPLISLGAGLDISTSSFVEGMDGETIINGGANTFVGFVGLPNLG